MTSDISKRNKEIMKRFKEPNITINGVKLSLGQSMTVRVAIEAFATSLSADGLGTDLLGQKICSNYIDRINEIREYILKDALAEGQ